MSEKIPYQVVHTDFLCSKLKEKAVLLKISS